MIAKPVLKIRSIRIGDKQWERLQSFRESGTDEKTNKSDIIRYAIELFLISRGY